MTWFYPWLPIFWPCCKSMENPLVVDHFPWITHGKPIALSPPKGSERRTGASKNHGGAQTQGTAGCIMAFFGAMISRDLHSDLEFKRFGCWKWDPLYPLIKIYQDEFIRTEWDHSQHQLAGRGPSSVFQRCWTATCSAVDWPTCDL